jgi:(R,R)-butanediol dehydrogenase/meso-butanediol dehydrogenase/diacetyl reductase
MGADYVINPLNEDPAKKVREIAIEGVDVSFDTAGVESTFCAGLDSLKSNGELMIVSVFTELVSYNVEVQRVGEQRITASRAYKHLFPKVIDLIVKGSIDVTPIITSKVKLEDIIDLGFNKLTASKQECKILVSFEF